jgi:hypothetical protein
MSIAYEWHRQFQETYAYEPGTLTPEQETELESENKAIHDELHCVGDGPHYLSQIIVSGDDFAFTSSPRTRRVSVATAASRSCGTTT